MTGSDRNEGEWPATLRDLLAGQARVRLATPEDNDQILAFFQHMTMKVRGLALRYDRSPNYFAHLQHQGRRQVVVLFFYADGALGGVAALGLNPVFVAGQVQWAGYFSDLRIGPALGRILGRHWAEFFAQCLRHLQTLAEPDACRFLYFAVLDQNQGALRSIARNRTPMTARALIKYESVNLLARVPLLWRVGLGVRRGSSRCARQPWRTCPASGLSSNGRTGTTSLEVPSATKAGTNWTGGWPSGRACAWRASSWPKHGIPASSWAA